MELESLIRMLDCEAAISASNLLMFRVNDFEYLGSASECAQATSDLIFFILCIYFFLVTYWRFHYLYKGSRIFRYFLFVQRPRSLLLQFGITLLANV